MQVRGTQNAIKENEEQKIPANRTIKFEGCVNSSKKYIYLCRIGMYGTLKFQH